MRSHQTERETEAHRRVKAREERLRKAEGKKL